MDNEQHIKAAKAALDNVEANIALAPVREAIAAFEAQHSGLQEALTFVRAQVGHPLISEAENNYLVQVAQLLERLLKAR